MSRLHHILILGVLGGCLGYAFVTRQTQVSLAPVETPLTATSEVIAAERVATEPIRSPPITLEEAASQSRIADLARMEADTKRQARAASKTWKFRSELRDRAHTAWTSMIATNTDTYLALHRTAIEAPDHETTCTICDRTGDMLYCILCRDSDGHCVTCQGTGWTLNGDDCPTCLGKKQCYLCSGTGHMPCVFCDDGIITRRPATPPKELPIYCEEPAEILAAKARVEKQNQAQPLNTVAQWIETAPSLQQVIEEERAQLAAQAPPPFVQRRAKELSFFLLCILAAPFIRRALLRHNAEAELRELCGKYLVDGREVADYAVPAWFAPLPQHGHGTWETTLRENITTPAPAGPSPVAEFFRRAPERLAKIRNVLKELTAAAPLETLQPILLQTHALVSELKEKASDFELRPAWQLLSALELLVKRVADKPKDLTPSILRTFATALDMLHEVCVPGIRPHLLMDPPLRILAVDDDPLCRRALQFALQKANFLTDLAENGERAVDQAIAHIYDVVFMDIQMPGTDGLTACGLIHQTKKNPHVPVIFVTIQSDFETRAEARLMGGSDLMAKPFLVFELTVRAIIYATRKRLQAAKTSRRQVTLLQAPVPAPAAALVEPVVLAV